MSDKGAIGLFGRGDGNRLPPNGSQLAHIFDDRPGHLPDTPRNRQLLLDLVNDRDNFRGFDVYGNDWYIEIDSQGRQLWGQTRDGIIQEGGRNDTPLDWDDRTGLNRNPFGKRR